MASIIFFVLNITCSFCRTICMFLYLVCLFYLLGCSTVTVLSFLILDLFPLVFFIYGEAYMVAFGPSGCHELFVIFSCLFLEHESHIFPDQDSICVRYVIVFWRPTDMSKYILRYALTGLFNNIWHFLAILFVCLLLFKIHIFVVPAL